MEIEIKKIIVYSDRFKIISEIIDQSSKTSEERVYLLQFTPATKWKAYEMVCCVAKWMEKSNRANLGCPASELLEALNLKEESFTSLVYEKWYLLTYKPRISSTGIFKLYRVTEKESENIVEITDNTFRHDFSSALFKKIGAGRDNVKESYFYLGNYKNTKIDFRLSKSWQIPFTRNHNFVGRNSEMKTLRDFLMNESQVVITQLISGLGGIGKTQLAIEYAHKYKSEYSGGAFWVSCGEAIISQYVKLGEKLELDFSPDTDNNKKASRIKEYLQEQEELTLLILDGLDNEEEYDSLRPFLPTTGNCHIIVTSRHQGMKYLKDLSLDTISLDSAIELLFKESNRKGESKEDAEEICLLLGNLPLAIEVAGKYLRYIPISLKDYHKKLTDRGLSHRSLSDGRKLPNTDHKAYIRATLEINHEVINKHQEFLSTLVCFAPESINPKLLCFALGKTWEDDEEDIWIEIKALNNYSLIKVETNKRLTIHRLLREVLKEQLSGDCQDNTKKNYVIRLTKWFEINKDAARIKLVEPEETHLKKILNLSDELEIKPQRYFIRIFLSTHYYHFGLYQKSIDLLDDVEDRILDDDDPAYADILAISYSQKGIVLRRIAEHEKAIEYHEKALAIYHKILPDSLDKFKLIADVLQNLSVSYNSLGNYDESIECVNQALTLDKIIYGEEHYKVGCDFLSLGGAYEGKEHYDNALSYNKKALDIFRKCLGESHPRVAMCLNNLGSVYIKKDEYQEAIKFIKHALSIDKKLYGNIHPDIAIRLSNLGKAWRCQFKLKKAKICYLLAISIDKKYYGVKHTEVATHLRMLGEIWFLLEKYAKASICLEQYISITKNTPKDKDQIAIDSFLLGSALLYQKKEYEKARTNFIKAYSIYLEIHGPDHILTKNSKVLLDRVNDEQTINGKIKKKEIEKKLKEYLKGILPIPENVKSLDEIKPLLKVYYDTIWAKDYDISIIILKDILLPNPLFFPLGAYNLCIELLLCLFPNGNEQKMPKIQKKDIQAWVLGTLGNCYMHVGQPRRSMKLHEMSIALCDEMSIGKNIAACFLNLAQVQMEVGELVDAHANLKDGIKICDKLIQNDNSNNNKFQKGVSHQKLGLLLAYKGCWWESETEFNNALAALGFPNMSQSIGVTLQYSSISELFQGKFDQALKDASKAYNWAKSLSYHVDTIRAGLLVGKAHRKIASSEDINIAKLQEAEKYISEALDNCKKRNSICFKADILLELAKIRQLQGKIEESKDLCQKALEIADQCEYRLQQADIHLFLAQIFHDNGNKTSAIKEIDIAIERASCGYKPTMDKAKQLKTIYLKSKIENN